MNTNGTVARLDYDEVKQAMHGRELEILAAICHELSDACDAAKNSDLKHVRCPFPEHEDLNPSFRIDTRQGCRFICTCNGGKGDAIDLICRLRGCDYKGTMTLVADYLGVTATDRKIPQPSVFELVSRTKNMPAESMKAYGAEEVTRGHRRVVRFPICNLEGDPEWHFDIGIPKGDSDFDKRLAKGMLGKDHKHGVFLPTGRKPQTGEIWFVTEGVKDATAMHSLGYNAMGVISSKTKVKFSRLLSGCHVFMVPDRDRPAYSGFHQFAGSLKNKATSVRMVILEAEFRESKGFDVRHILKRPDGKESLMSSIESAVEWTPNWYEPEGTRGKPRVLMPGQQSTTTEAGAELAQTLLENPP